MKFIRAVKSREVHEKDKLKSLVLVLQPRIEVTNTNSDDQF